MAAVGCQTTPTTATAPPPPEPVEAAPPPFGFAPTAYFAPIRAGQVRYRMLYAPESHAIWVTDQVRAMKLNNDLSAGFEVGDDVKHTAEVADAHFVIIECRLESAFADSSVAYDVVGLRNIEVYLETPAGERIYPVQRIMAPHADETMEDALIRFGRTTILVFPKRDLLGNGPSAFSDAPAVRLVLEGFHSNFYFEWQNAGRPGPVEAASASVSAADAALDAVRTGYTSIYSLLSPLQRIVD